MPPYPTPPLSPVGFHKSEQQETLHYFMSLHLTRGNFKLGEKTFHKCRSSSVIPHGLAQLQALVYDILPSNTAVFCYAILSKNCQLTSSFLLVLK